MKWTVFCNAADRFSWVWAFLQKKSFWSLNAQNHFFRASKNTNSVFSATKQIMRMRGPQTLKNFFLSEKKLLNAILRAKHQVHEKCFFLMKWTVFCNAADRFSWVWAFLQKKSFWSLNAQNHFFRASKNTNSVFSATKANYENARPTDAQKLLSQWEKVAKCNFKEQSSSTWKMFLSNEMNSFLQCSRQIFMSLSFFCRKSHFRA